MPNFASRFSTEGFLSGSLLFLCGGVFLGNTFIATGQGLLVIGIVYGLLPCGDGARNWRQPRGSYWFLAVGMVISLLSILGNLDTIAEPMDLVKKLRYHLIILGALLLPALRSGEVLNLSKRNLYVVAWIGGLVLSVAFGLVEILGNEAGESERLSGLYGQVMTFAYILQFSVIALLVFFIRPEVFRGLTSVPWAVVVPVLAVAAIGLYLSFTRGAVLGAVVGMAVALLYRSKQLILPFAVLAVVAGILSYQQKDRYFDFGPVHRVSHWQGAALTFAKYPLLGVGYRNYESRSAELKKEFGLPRDQKFKKQNNSENGYLRRHAHNNYLEAFASTGVFGGLAFLGFCFCWTREASRSRYAFIFVPLIVAFLISGFFENTFFDSEVLNCILLIYLISQIVFDREAGTVELDHSPEGVTTTET